MERNIKELEHIKKNRTAYPNLKLFQFSSVQSLSHVQLFVTPWTVARLASLSITNSWSPLKLVSIVLVMPSNHLILCRPLLPLPSIFPRIRVFSNESALRIRWPKYWSFSFNIIPHFLSFRWTLKTFFRQNVEHHHFLLFSDILHRKTFLSYQIALLSCFSKLSFLSPINISFYIWVLHYHIVPVSFMGKTDEKKKKKVHREVGKRMTQSW